MVLGFMWRFKNGDPTMFENKILAKVKKHTCRVDKGDRWKVGMSIQMVLHNRTPNRRQFNTGIEDLSKCTGINFMAISFQSESGILAADKQIFYSQEKVSFCLYAGDPKSGPTKSMFIGGTIEHLLRCDLFKLFSLNDGFDTPSQCLAYFAGQVLEHCPPGHLTATWKLINWSDSMYF